MMSEGLFTGLLVVFWLAEFAFAAVVVYWFVTQGFVDDDVAAGDQFPLESRAATRRSLAVWAAFFGALVVLILVGA